MIKEIKVEEFFMIAGGISCFPNYTLGKLESCTVEGSFDVISLSTASESLPVELLCQGKSAGLVYRNETGSCPAYEMVRLICNYEHGNPAENCVGEVYI